MSFNRPTWYKKVLTEKRNEVFLAITLTATFSLAMLLWHYAMGQSFHWEATEPIEQPGLLPRLFYSALVFAGPGRWLFDAGFYKALYSLFKGTRGGYRAFTRAKADIWHLMILATCFVVIPWAVNILNTLLSFTYNIVSLILYLVPPLGVTPILGAGFLLWKKNLALQSAPIPQDPTLDLSGR